MPAADSPAVGRPDIPWRTLFVVALGFLGLATSLLLMERRHLIQERLKSDSRVLGSTALRVKSWDPELGTLLATEAVRIASTLEAEQALRSALGPWHLRTVLRDHTSDVRTVFFTPDGNKLITAGWDGLVLWNRRTGQKITHIDIGHPEHFDAGSVSTDSRLLVTPMLPFEPNTAALWDLETGLTVVPLYVDAAADGARFSPDGTQVILFGVGQTVELWNIATKRRIVSLPRQPLPVQQAVLSRSGTVLLTRNYQDGVRLWDLRTARQLVALTEDQHVADAGFDPTDQVVIVDAERVASSRACSPHGTPAPCKRASPTQTAGRSAICASVHRHRGIGPLKSRCSG